MRLPDGAVVRVAVPRTARVPNHRGRTEAGGGVRMEELNADNLTVTMITMNEEKAIAKVIGDIRQHVPQAEILVVDSSKDRTAEIAEGLGARVIKQFPPKGYGPAMDLALR